MADFTGKTALVTGAATGIGRAVASRLADDGAHVYLTGRRVPELEKAAADIGANATPLPGDISRAADLDAIIDAIAADGRRLDHVVANAGVAVLGPLAETSEEVFDLTFDINVKGTFLTVRKALPLLNDGASVVLVGSNTGIKGALGFGSYAASKAAVRSLGRTFAAELAPRGIRVNVMSPGITNTEGAAELAVLNGLEDVSELLVPLKRGASPHEPAALAVFLLSEEASFMTGGEYFVDGGQTQV